MRKRSAFTLLEILLALGILVILASLAGPALFQMLASESLRQAAETLRADFAQARVEAMQTGRIHAFRFEPGGDQYVIEVWVADDDALEGDGLAVETGPGGGTFAGVGDVQRLPEGVTFLGMESLGSTRDAAAEQSTANPGIGVGLGSQSANGDDRSDWSQPILFYADGTASTARVVMLNEEEFTIEVLLRGLTGIGRIGARRPLSEVR